MKLLSTLLLASLAALAVYSARRRIVYALKTGAVVYIVLLFGRLLLSAGSLGERWEDLIWPVFFILVGWVILWRVSTTYAERRSKTIRSASEAGRRARRFR